MGVREATVVAYAVAGDGGLSKQGDESESMVGTKSA